MNEEIKQIDVSKKRDKREKIIIVVLIVLIVIVLGLTIFVIVDNGNKKKEIKRIDVSEKEEKEITIKSISLKKELSKKIDEIIYFVPETEGKDFYKQSAYGFRKELASGKQKLNDEQKLIIALDSISDKFGTLMIDPDKMDLGNEKKGYEGEEEDVYRQIDIARVNQKYRELFGSKIKNYLNVGRCPHYIYDKTNQLYYSVAQCGGTTDVMILSYKYKYTTKDDKAYVYVSFGNAHPDGYDIGSSVKIYKGLEDSKGIYDSYAGSIEKFEINENNYKEFEQYKYVFKKDDDESYYFVGVENI